MLFFRLFVTEGSGHTLQPTALVHEAFAKLVDADVSWQDRAHFFALSGRMMRRLLVNHACARKAGKRGGDAIRVTLVETHQSKFPDLRDRFRALKARMAGRFSPSKVNLDWI